MEKNIKIKGLPDDCDDKNGVDNTTESNEIKKYKEIKMPSHRDGRGKGNISLGSPINCDVANVNPGARHINSVFDDENLADKDTVPCPTCRGTGTIQAGIFNFFFGCDL